MATLLFDFAAKYLHEQDQSVKVKLFLDKLKSKGQSSVQCQQAAHAVALYFDLIADNADRRAEAYRCGRLRRQRAPWILISIERRNARGTAGGGSPPAEDRRKGLDDADYRKMVRSDLHERHGAAAALIIVFEADDVIFTEIFAALHLDDDQRNHSGVLQAVGHSHGNEGGLVNVVGGFVVAARYLGGSGHYDPVLAPVMVHLKRQPLPGVNFDPFDLVILVFLENGIGSPGAFAGFHASSHYRLLKTSHLAAVVPEIGRAHV